MAVYVICPSCNTKLAVPTNKPRPKGICPRCQTVIRVVLPASRGEETQLHTPKHEEPVAIQQPFVDSDVPEELPLPVAYDFNALKVDEEPEFVEPEPELVEPIEEPETTPSPGRKKKKRKREYAESAPVVQDWLWWTIGAGALAFLELVVAVVLVFAGHGDFVLEYVVSMIFLVPCSMIILVVSMLIANAVLGGIDFGSVFEAIPKGILLLIVVNSVSLIPHVGTLAAYPVWLIGLIALFRLDFFEAALVMFVNGTLNTLIKIFLIAIILNAIMKPGHVPDDVGGSKAAPRLQTPPGKSTPLEDLDRGLDGD